mmetsp:Transcript_143298/g.260730  ORF Transcript_143298/g.260730 Transcript_143298/m.260730 type:complete len:1659 (-) Transcript_143298:49-5025(-)
MDTLQTVSLWQCALAAQGSDVNDDDLSVSSARTVQAEDVEGSEPEAPSSTGPVGHVYKVLERANSTTMNSTRVAKLCTDLIFATVMQKAGDDISEEQFEDAMVRAALRKGVDAQIQSLAKTSAATLQRALREAPDSSSTQPQAPGRMQASRPHSPASSPTSASTATGPATPASQAEAVRPVPPQFRPSAAPPFCQTLAPRPAARSPRAGLGLDARDALECGNGATPSSSRTSASQSETSGSRSQSSSPARLVPLPTLLPRRNTAPLPVLSPEERHKSRSKLGPFAQRGSSSSSGSAGPGARAASVEEVFEAASSGRGHSGLSKASFVQLCRRCHQLCRNCDLTSSKLTATDAEQIFASLVSPNQKHMDAEQFEVAVSRLADKMAADEHMVRRAIVAAGVPRQEMHEEMRAALSPLQTDSSVEHTPPTTMRPSSSPFMRPESPELVRSPVRSKSVPGLLTPSLSDEKSSASSGTSTSPPVPQNFLRPSFTPGYSMPRGRAREQRVRNLAKALEAEERPSPSASAAGPSASLRPDCSPAYMMHRPAELSDAVDKPAEADAPAKEPRALSAPEGAQDLQQTSSFLKPSCLAGYSMNTLVRRRRPSPARLQESNPQCEAAEPTLRRSFLAPLSQPGASTLHKCMQPQPSSPAKVEEAKQALVDAIISGALGAALTKIKQEGTLQQAAQQDTARVREKCSQTEAKQAIFDATMSAMANLQQSETSESTDANKEHISEELAETRVREVQEAFLDLMNGSESPTSAVTSPKSPKDASPQGSCEPAPQLRRSFPAAVGAGVVHKCMQWKPEPPPQNLEAEPELRRSFTKPLSALGVGVTHKCMQWNPEAPRESRQAEPQLRRSFVKPAADLGAGMMHKCMQWTPEAPQESCGSEPELRRSFPKPSAVLGAGTMHKCMKWNPEAAPANSPKEEAPSSSGAEERSKEEKVREVHQALVSAILSGKLQAVVKKLRQPEPKPECRESDKQAEQNAEEDDVRAAARKMVNWAVHRCRSYDRTEEEAAAPSPSETPSRPQPALLRPSCTPGYMKVRAHSTSPAGSSSSSSTSSTSSTPCSRPCRPSSEAPAARRPSRSSSKVRLQRACVSDLYSRVGKAYFGNKDGGRKEEPAQATTSQEEEAVAPTVVAPVAKQAPEQASADCKATVEEVYNSFCSVGRAGMSSRGFTKFCKHCQLLDDICTAADAEQIFAQVVLKGHRHINYQQFERSLALLSEKRNVGEAALRLTLARAGANEVPMKERRRSQSRNEVSRASSSASLHPTPSTSTLGCDESVVRRSSSSFRLSRLSSCSTTVQSSRTPSPMCGLPTFHVSSDSRSSSITPKYMPAALSQNFKQRPVHAGQSGASQTSESTAATAKFSSADQSRAQETEGTSKPSNQFQARPTPPPAEDFARRAPRYGAKPAERLGELLAGSSQRRRSSASKAVAGQHARDALDIALVTGATQHRHGVSIEECAQARRRGSEALGLAVLAEAYDAGLDITREEIMQAKKKAQGALEFTLMTKRDLDLGSEEFQDVKTHARDALQVGLLQGDMNEQQPDDAEPRVQGRAHDAIDQVVRMFRDARYSRLSPQQLEEAKFKAVEAVDQALATDVELAGLDLSPEARQKAARRAHVNLDAALLRQDAPNEEPAERRRRASDALHLAILGVQLCA